MPTGGTFGSTTSPAKYECFAQARAFLAEYLSRREDLVLKHQALLSKICFAPPATATTKFVVANADSRNPGVLLSNNESKKTQHNPFVDDTLIAEIPRFMLVAMAASVESLFLLFGRDSPFRRSFLSLDKFTRALCSWEK